MWIIYRSMRVRSRRQFGGEGKERRRWVSGLLVSRTYRTGLVTAVILVGRGQYVGPSENMTGRYFRDHPIITTVLKSSTGLLYSYNNSDLYIIILLYFYLCVAILSFHFTETHTFMYVHIHWHTHKTNHTMLMLYIPSYFIPSVPDSFVSHIPWRKL